MRSGIPIDITRACKLSRLGVEIETFTQPIISCHDMNGDYFLERNKLRGDAPILPYHRAAGQGKGGAGGLQKLRLLIRKCVSWVAKLGLVRFRHNRFDQLVEIGTG